VKSVIGPDGVQYPVTSAVDRFLGSMNETGLAALVLELASYSPEAMRSLQLRAAPDDSPVLRELVAAIDDALAGVDLDYHDPFYGDEDDDGVQGVEEVIDELERHLDTGANKVVRRALEHLLTRVGDLARDAADAEALLGVMERASGLFGRAVEGHSDPVSLARWVVGFRVEHGGWPSLGLDLVAHVFDEQAWAAYRASIAALDGGGPGADPYRREVDRMLLELADHDGDVDHAVALLSGTDCPYYAEIVKRLRAVGRQAEVLDWLDRAVADGSVDFAWRGGRRIVAAEEAAVAYLEGGRPDAALAVPRRLFSRDLSVAAYRLLGEVAQRCGDWDEQRAWAFEQATSRAHSTGGVHLVRLCLADGDVEHAWETADAFGAGGAWRELVDASEAGFPLRAARLCLAQVLAELGTPNSRQYPRIVGLIVRARSLYEKAGHRSEADTEIIRLRETFRRRPALTAEMNRARLPA
jgi:tetratricopeptide (TPR) repeat protein